MSGGALQVVEAWAQMIAAAKEFDSAPSTFQYDLVDVGRQVRSLICRWCQLNPCKAQLVLAQGFPLPALSWLMTYTFSLPIIFKSSMEVGENCGSNCVELQSKIWLAPL